MRRLAGIMLAVSAMATTFGIGMNSAAAAPVTTEATKNAMCLNVPLLGKAICIGIPYL